MGIGGLRELSPLALRQSELKISEANAGAKTVKCTSAVCPLA